jgi:hypothetical protein
MRRFISVLVMLMFIAFSLTAQSQNPSAPPENMDPVPYGPDEFPGWSKSLRRAEIVTLGLFPFVFLFSSLAYDAGRYSMHNFDSRYAPGLFQSADSVSRSSADTRNVIMISISLSVFLAVIDLIIEENKPQKAR